MMTLASGMTQNVGKAISDLGDGASPDEIAEAMRRAMQMGATPNR